MEIEPFVKNLPKVELHVHIEGTLTPDLRWALAKKNNIPLASQTLEELKSTYDPVNEDPNRELLRGSGLAIFLKQYFGGIETLCTKDDFYELTISYFRKAAAMNVRHAEVFFDPQAHTRRGVPVKAVMDGLKQARDEAQKTLGLTCDFVMCFLRDMSPESAVATYDECLPYRALFSGIGLDSNEHDRPPSLFDEIFRRARKDGFKLTSHCDVGQKNTHEHIHQVVSTLADGGLDRIDHGLNAADKPELVQAVKKRGIGMTLCPQAYARRWPEDQVFPVIRRLFEEGVKVSINSDDPTYMQMMYIEENMQLVRTKCGFSNDEMCTLVRNAIETCWASTSRKEELYSELRQLQSKDAV